MEIQAKTKVLQGARSFSGGTLISRFLGMLREIVMAASFGTHPLVGAFLLAYRFSYLLRPIFGEGAFHAAFVPQFESIRQRDSQRAQRFFLLVKKKLFFLLLCIVSVVELFLLISSTYLSLDWNLKEVLLLMSLMLPGLFFLCLSTLNASFLQCNHYYFIPGLAPAALNIIWIFLALFFSSWDIYRAIPMVSIGLVFAFFCQWLLTLPQTKKLINVSLQDASHDGCDQEFSGLRKAFFMGVLGVSAIQINSALDALFARYAQLEGPAYLWYALRLQQLPVALFGVAVMNATFPPLARAESQKNKAKYASILTFSVRKSFTLMVCCTFACLSCGLATVNLLYGRGVFSPVAVIQTGLCLWAYSLALFPTTMVTLFSSAFYAVKDYKIPFMGALLTLCINFLLNSLFIFVFSWKSISVALATSASAFINMFFLYFRFKKKRETLSFSPMFPAFFKVFVIGFLACFFTLILCEPSLLVFFNKKSLITLPRLLLDQIKYFILHLTCFSCFLFLFSYLFKDQEIRSLLHIRHKE